LIQEVQITKYKVGDKIFDSKEDAEFYDNNEREAEERLKELSIDEDIEIPWLLYENLTDGVLAKNDSGFKLFIAHNTNDLNFLCRFHRWYGPISFNGNYEKTPCIVAINKFRHMFITMDTLIEKGEELSRKYQRYEDKLAEMEKQIVELEQKLGVN